jgi:hypothetical protein
MNFGIIHCRWKYSRYSNYNENSFIDPDETEMDNFDIGGENISNEPNTE